MKRVVFTLWLIFHVGGFVAASYGVLREAFATLASELGVFEPGLFEKGLFEGGLARWQDLLVLVGVKLRLLPGEKVLTLQDRKWNAALAIAGVCLIAVSIIFDLWQRGMHERQRGRHTKTQKLRRAAKTRRM